jgi:multidrug efflux pump subunit AcrB
MKLGLSGWVTRASISSPLTPLFLITALALGSLAVITIPREEEPQISVPMIDISVRASGLRADEVVELVTKPLETIVKSVDGVEHIYSQTEDDQVLVTARFLVGTNPDAAAVRIHEKIRANMDRVPNGIPEPLVAARSINDVPIVVVTLTPKAEVADRWTDQALFDVAEELRNEIAKTANVGLSFLVGGRPLELRVEPDPGRLSSLNVPLGAVINTLKQANRSFPLTTLRGNDQAVAAVSGDTLLGPEEVGLLGLKTADGRSIYLRDVATITEVPRDDESRVWSMTRTGKGWQTTPAISLAVAKRPGANAVDISHQVVARIDALKGRLIPNSLDVEITRNYGETANDKANELLFHLGLATLSIVILIGFAIGLREALVTAIVIPTTIMLTLFAANLMGYTVNRVSLFALIFSIGILVDDAIVVIENIARHWAMKDGRSRMEGAIDAVAEVGNPTIIATLTVVAALLPMMFVSGLMGPYMAPIPANASAAMLFSFVVAVVLVPWLMLRVHDMWRGKAGEPAHADHDEGALGRLYRRVAEPVIRTRRRAWLFLASVGVATLLACSLFVFKGVTVKLLPFDNKSELQVVLDMPEGSTLEATERVLLQAAEVVKRLPETVSVQAYAGTSAPFSFNGLVRHYYMRQKPEQGDLQVNLSPKDVRDRASHDIALDLRAQLRAIPLPLGGSLKVVEVPPGPPVISTLLAEIYGPDAETRRKVALEVKEIFKSVPYIVDVDDSFGTPRPRLRLTVNRDAVEFFGLEEGEISDSLGALLNGTVVGHAQRGEGRNPIEISVRLPRAEKSWNAELQSTPVAVTPGPRERRTVELGEVMTAREEAGSLPVFRRDGHFAEMVSAELAGAYEAPIYGMLDVNAAIDAKDWGALPKPVVRLYGQPEDESVPSVLWDGEWEITYVTFRDMGAAFMVALLGIYVLVVFQFGSFKLPLVILTPIPLTLIGIMIGHALFNAPFTATSMIGFIALAGIIVRNSILLTDFIRHGRAPGRSLREVLLEAGAIRFKPILLTALAAMIGAAVILTDPIFQGLAISLLFGLASSTLLTVLVIPAIYIVLRDDVSTKPLSRPSEVKP